MESSPPKLPAGLSGPSATAVAATLTVATLPPQMIEDAGFRGVSYENLTMGVVAIHDGFKMA